MAPAAPPVRSPSTFSPITWRILASGILLMALVFPSQLTAQEPERRGAEFIVNTTPGYTVVPRVGMTSAGEFLVLWTTRPGWFADSEERGQSFLSDGSPRGGEFLLDSLPPGRGASMAMDESARFVVLWREGGYDPYGPPEPVRTMVQRFDPEGTPLQAPREVEAGIGDVASDADGDFVVVWAVEEPYPFSTLFARRFSSSGNPRGGEFQVNVSSVLAAYGPGIDVASTASGEFVVVWKNTLLTSPGYPRQILGRRFDSTGSPRGGEIQVNALGGSTATAEGPSVAVNDSGGFAVAWRGGDYTSPDVRARQFDSDGMPAGAEFQVGGPGSFYFVPPGPKAALDEAGRLVVVWQQEEDDYAQVRARGFTSVGSPIGSEVRVDSSPPWTGAYDPALGMDDAGNFVVVWESYGPYGSDLRAQRFSWEAAPSNQPPVADAGADVDRECTSPAGAVVALDGSASSDPDSTPGSHDDIVRFEWFLDFETPSEMPLGEGVFLDVELPLGLHAVTLRVTDAAGETATDDLVVTVFDATPPSLTVVLSPEVLWPPSHRMVKVSASVDGADTCGSPAVILESVGSSEPDDAPGTGDGSTTGDIAGALTGTADFDFLLRSERQACGPGRTYTVVYTATDAAGLSTSETAAVTVPRDRRHGAGPGKEAEHRALPGRLKNSPRP